MQTIAKILSLIMLGLVAIPSLLYFAGTVELETVKLSALLGSIGWFIVTPMWMSRKLPVDAGEVEI